MSVYSRLFSTEVKNLLTEKYDKIKTQVSSFNQDGGRVKEYTYTLVDEAEIFNVDRFIREVSSILMRFKINFAVGYILNEEMGLRYYHQWYMHPIWDPL